MNLKDIEPLSPEWWQLGRELSGRAVYYGLCLSALLWLPLALLGVL